MSDKIDQTDQMNKMEGIKLLAADAYALKETFNPVIELKVRGLSGPGSVDWVPIREIWSGRIDKLVTINFSLAHGAGWICIEPAREVQLRSVPA